MVSNATLEILAHFIPPIESTSLGFDPTWEEIACAADDVGGAKKHRCAFAPYVRANELVSFSSLPVPVLHT